MRRAIFVTFEWIAIFLLLWSKSTPAMLMGFPMLLCLSLYLDERLRRKPEFYVSSFDTNFARQKRAVAMIKEWDN